MATTITITRFLSLFETNAIVTAAVNRHPLRTFQFPTKSLSSRTLRLRHYTSSSSSASAITDETTTTGESETSGDYEQQHPWAEWVSFVDHLKSKGYINNEEEAGGSDMVSVYKDMTILKEACLSFGRDRFDLFKSLSMQDIQTLVEKGCPNINRKTVNSGKRLRSHLQLDEGDVCGICVFKGSCDRAYVILKDSESDARTVDIVRILLSYALNPFVGSDNKPSGVELVEASAKKLLLELTELSDTKVDPELQNSAATVARKAQSAELTERDSELQKPVANAVRKVPFVKITERESPRNVDMKRGDWLCPKCNFLNFSRNKKCRECNEDGPQNAGGNNVEMKKGDWNCPQCNFMNFWRNIRCLKCKTEGPKRVGTNDVEMKKGDWNCPQCQFMNFASNTKCFRCREQRPKRQGECECPS
ncbi:zinc finger protein VAR3, chloroplastic-like [Bidens hawaiensis]|uniref:zinc finger protein VAR3, chloroplastic-like n=1 Tax=Bidens hawaiensis TaxID=980011 RepID=UPI00404A9F13